MNDPSKQGRGLAVQNFNNSKADVFFASFFVYIVNDEGYKKTEKTTDLQTAWSAWISSDWYSTDGEDCEIQMAYFLGIVIWSFSIKVELLVGYCWSPCCRFFNEKRFNFVKD